MLYHIDHGTIEVLQGDIVGQDTAAIVNAANNLLWMGAGVAGAIKRNGGQAIEDEAVALGPVEIGQSVITGAGSLRARHVIHAAVMGQDLHTDASRVTAATRSALALAESRQLDSVSFPALGTGVGGFSVHHCARIMLTEGIAFLISSRYVRHVRFVLFDDQSYRAFSDELHLQFSSKRHS